MENNESYQQENMTTISNRLRSLEQVCERCAIKEAEVHCPSCQPLKNFCNSCDINVHTLVTKKSHKRDILKKVRTLDDLDFNSSTNFVTGIKTNTNLTTNNDLSSSKIKIDQTDRNNIKKEEFIFRDNQSNLNKDDFKSETTREKFRSCSNERNLKDHKLNKSHLNLEEYRLKRKEHERRNFSPSDVDIQSGRFTSNYFNKNINNAVPRSLNRMQENFPTSTEYYVKSPVLSPKRENNYRLLSPDYGKKHNSSTTHFSKQYVNELKLMHDKEKEELMHKNQALSNNLERLKSSFNDQIYLLQKSLTDAKVKSNNELLLLSKEKDHEHDKLLENFREKERKLKEDNETLIRNIMNLEEKLSVQNSNFNNFSNQKENRIKELESALEMKTREFIEINNDLKRKNDDLQRKLGHDIDNLVDQYENSFSRMSQDYQREISNKDQQMRVKDDKINQLEINLSKLERNLEECEINKNMIVEELKTEKYSMQKEVDMLRAGRNNLSGKLELGEKTEISLRNELSLKSKDLDHLRSTLNRHENEIRLLQEKEKNLSLENQKLKNLTENYQRNSDSQVHDIIFLQENNEALKKSNFSLNNQVVTLEKQMESYKRSSFENKDDINQLNLQVQTLIRENNNLTESYEAMRKDVIRIQKELEIVDLEREKLRMESINLKEEVSIS